MPRAVTNLKQFNAAMKREARKMTRDDFSAFLRKISFDILGRIQSRSLIKTNRSRGNWLVSVGQPREDELPPPYPLDDVRPQEIAETALQALEHDPYSVVWFANNVEYISFLEFGTDRIDPVGMLSRAFGDYVDHLQK